MVKVAITFILTLSCRARYLLLVLPLLIVSLKPALTADITMAITTTKPPYILDRGEGGIEIDIARQALARGGHTLVPVPFPQKRVILAYKNGHVDAALTVNAGFGLDGYLSDVTIAYQNHAISLSGRSLDIKTLGDIRGYGIVAFPNAHIYLGPLFADIANSSPDYREIPNQNLQARILLSGRADIAVSDKRIFQYFVKQSVGRKAPVPELDFAPVFPPSQYRNIFRAELIRDAFNAGLKDLRLSGDYDLILSKYDSPPTD